MLCCLCGAKPSHAFKLCERLKASNTMTTFGSWSSSSAVSLQNSTKNDLRRSEIKNFPRGTCPHTHLPHALRALYAISHVHTGTPLFQILDLPLLRHYPSICAHHSEICDSTLSYLMVCPHLAYLGQMLEKGRVICLRNLLRGVGTLLGFSQSNKIAYYSLSLC